jgi:hypothetical protein
MIRWPNLLGGTHKLVGWLNSLLIGCRAAEIKQVIGPGRLISSTDGKIIEIYHRPAQFEAHPFRIYQSDTWLKYKVTDGIAITTGNPITVTNTETEITITSGVTYYWFYLEMTATTCEVKSSATTLVWSNLLIPIGWVDTTVANVGDINQALKDNVFNPCAT